MHQIEGKSPSQYANSSQTGQDSPNKDYVLDVPPGLEKGAPKLNYIHNKRGLGFGQARYNVQQIIKNKQGSPIRKNKISLE